MTPGLQALLLGLLIVVAGATHAPSATPSPTATLAPSVTKTLPKISCYASPPSCDLLLKMKTICAPYKNHKKPCNRFCRKLQFSFWVKAGRCKSRAKTRFSTLFSPCMRKCAVVRRAAVAAARKGITFDGVVSLTRPRGHHRPLRGPGGKSACWYCRHRGTHCGACCGSDYWCPDW